MSIKLYIIKKYSAYFNEFLLKKILFINFLNTFVYTTVSQLEKIEHIIKANMPLPLSKKTIVSILYSSGQINSALNNVLKPYDISIQQFNEQFYK